VIDASFIVRLGLSCLIAAVITAGLLVARVEWRWMRSRGELSRHAMRKMWFSLSALPPNVLVTVLMTPVWHSLYSQAASAAVANLPLNALTVVAALVLADFSYYWEHRCAHRLRWLWAAYHAFHHSADTYTVAVAYRVSFVSQFFAPAFYVPWVLLGIDPLVMLAMQLFVFHYQAWIHTELIGPLGGFDRWFNSPANHRVHHSRAAEHTLANLGGVTLVWDRLFGTYVGAPAAALVYGIGGEQAPKSVIAMYTRPWRRISGDSRSA
jgi:sterol desaturase/sphingolipid hydroxylase (fatty acid hydroxylase superfamily)